MKLNKKKFFAGLMTALMLAIVLVPGIAMAAVNDDCCLDTDCGADERCVGAGSGSNCNISDSTSDLGRCRTGSGISLPDSDIVDDSMDLETTIETVINAVLGFLGFIAVIIILIGGFQWMTAAGDDSKVDKAKKTLSAGVIGLIIILAAWGIASFVIGLLVN